LLDDLALLRRAGDAKLLRRRADDRAGLQQDDPVLVPDVVRVDADLVARHFSAKDAHGDPPWLARSRHQTSTRKARRQCRRGSSLTRSCDGLKLSVHDLRLLSHHQRIFKMRSIGIALSAALTILSAIGASVGPTSAAGSRAFCSTWLNLCNKTCPGGPGTCGDVCAARFSTCLSSGCFPFNVPGPRCEGNARDQAATDQVKNRMQKGQSIGCGPRFGGRPCDPR